MGFNEREEKRNSVVSQLISDTPSPGRPKVNRETKKRASFAILPSLYDNVSKIAYVDRIPVSEIISQCLEKYVEENKPKLKEYEKIKK